MHTHVLGARLARDASNRTPAIGASSLRWAGSWLLATTYTPDRLPPRWRHPLLGYLVAILLSVVAALLTLFLLRVLPSTAFAFPDLFPLAALVVIALVWGAGPSLVALGLSVILLQTVVLARGVPTGASGPLEAVDVSASS